ncbi:nuclear transport factor 2 family protein [Variovorax sp.]|jgi:hypothetical protein|uniref:nuclear transport factor 2 family protein n=1 Tax=Variovorax sp. TaxID=1871043 RepID=UPI0037DA4727
MKPEDAVQRQLLAYNAKDLDAFVAEYAEDVRTFRPPAPEPVLVGREALRTYYRDHRFVLPELHAEVVQRMVVGNKVIDHERITGLAANAVEMVAVYEVIDGRIRNVWFHPAESAA